MSRIQEIKTSYFGNKQETFLARNRNKIEDIAFLLKVIEAGDEMLKSIIEWNEYRSLAHFLILIDAKNEYKKVRDEK